MRPGMEDVNQVGEPFHKDTHTHTHTHTHLHNPAAAESFCSLWFQRRKTEADGAFT